MPLAPSKLQTTFPLKPESGSFAVICTTDDPTFLFSVIMALYDDFSNTGALSLTSVTSIRTETAVD